MSIHQGTCQHRFYSTFKIPSWCYDPLHQKEGQQPLTLCGLPQPESHHQGYPLPLLTDLLNAPKKVHVFTKIDLHHTYYLIQIADGKEWKTTFHTHYTSFEWLVMPFGLTNAPVAFQRFMNDIFSDLLDVCIIIYLDDILIYSEDMTQHKKHIKEVLWQLHKNGLYMATTKCEFHKESVEYLGFIISVNGLCLAQDKVQIILNWREPQRVRDVQSFLGFCNFYRCFIFGYSDIVIPLIHLT